MEEAMPLNSFFVLSRYLNPLLRYNDSKILNRWTRDLHFFPGTSTRRYLHRVIIMILVRILDRPVRGGASEKSECATRKDIVNDEKLPFSLHDDISGTRSSIEINQKAF